MPCRDRHQLFRPLACGQQDDVPQSLVIFGGAPALFEILFLHDLCNGGQGAEVEIAFVTGCGQDTRKAARIKPVLIT